MNPVQRTVERETRNERGSIMILTAVMLVGLVLAVGLCIDVARIYMMRAELQNAADAAALAAARELDQGSTGIDRAATAATSAALSGSNSYGLGKTSITIANVEFARNLPVSGAESYTSKAAFDAMTATQKAAFASTVRFVRVTTSTGTMSILFTIGRLGASRSETAKATAGASVGINNVCNYYPVGIAKADPSTPFPANTRIDLRFIDNPGNSVNLIEKDFVVLQDGNGANDTIQAFAANGTNCTFIGAQKSPSANKNNGPDQVSQGTNTRFDEYAPGHQLNPTDYPPDKNIYQDSPSQPFTSSDYVNGTLTQAPQDPGVTDRRIMVATIVDTGPSGGTFTIRNFEAFLILKRVNSTKDCNKVPNCVAGTITVMKMPDNFVIGGGTFDPNTTGSSTLTVPVLYK